MKLPIASVAALGLLTLVGAPVATTAMTRPPTAQEQMNYDRCFRTADIDSFKAVDDDHINIRILGGAVYQLTMRTPCAGLQMERSITVRGQAGSSFACNGEDITILTRSPEATNGGRCVVQSFRKLSKEEAAALPTSQKP